MVEERTSRTVPGGTPSSISKTAADGYRKTRIVARSLQERGTAVTLHQRERRERTGQSQPGTGDHVARVMHS
jgi:hypothetical protein